MSIHCIPEFTEKFMRGVLSKRRHDTAQEIANDLGCSSGLISRWRTKTKLSYIRPEKKIDLKKFSRMWLDGASIRAISQHFQFRESRVGELRRELGLPPRTDRRHVSTFTEAKTEKIEKKIKDKRKQAERIAAAPSWPGWTLSMDLALFETDGKYREISLFAAKHNMSMQRVKQRFHQLRNL